MSEEKVKEEVVEEETSAELSLIDLLSEDMDDNVDLEHLLFSTLVLEIHQLNKSAARIAGALEKLIGDKEAAGKAEKVKQGLLERRKKKEVKPMK